MARLADPSLADRRRRQILVAAMACFRRRGFHQATMQEICAEANMSAGALYRYFGSKAEIIGAIAEEKHADSDKAFLEATRKGSLIDALSLMAREFFDKFADGDGALIADIFAEAIRDEAVAAPLLKINQNSFDYCVEAIKAAQARGEIDEKLDAREAANTLFAAIEGIALRRAFLRDTDPDAAVAQFRALAQRYLSRR
ncbi:MAG TPA: TetR/AcrR family transcriptional regulator [Candidatus Binatia bacterium]|nr:TetR/AcrR family transcriptional regulator [Candidatus Binatia bacterium]